MDRPREKNFGGLVVVERLRPSRVFPSFSAAKCVVPELEIHRRRVENGVIRPWAGPDDVNSISIHSCISVQQ